MRKGQVIFSNAPKPSDGKPGKVVSLKFGKG